PRPPLFPYTTLFRSALADRAGLAVHAVRTVRGGLAAEAVALHRAGEALALADRGDVDQLARGEQLGGELLADLVVPHVLEPQLEDRKSTRLNSSHVK